MSERVSDERLAGLVELVEMPPMPGHNPERVTLRGGDLRSFLLDLRDCRACLDEYLNDICDAWEAYRKLVDRPDHPSDDEVEQHGDEVAAAWGRLEDALETACGAREGE